MTVLPPSPFISSASAEHAVETSAAASNISPQARDAAVGRLDDIQPDIPLAELVKRGFDEDGFLNDIEPLPAFLGAPSGEYLRATDLIPVLEVLAGRA